MVRSAWVEDDLTVCKDLLACELQQVRITQLVACTEGRWVGDKRLNMKRFR